jgi:type I restriction enzyme R subunit
VIRHGFKCFGKLIRVAYFAQAHAMNPDSRLLYEANRLTVTRQPHYSTRNDSSIPLGEGDNVPVEGPTAVGTGKSKDSKIELSRLIDVINERFGTDFTQADELFFHQIREEALADETLRQVAAANTLDNFRYVFVKALEAVFIDRMEQNEELFAKYMNDADFRKVVSEHLLKQVYDKIRAEGAA